MRVIVNARFFYSLPLTQNQKKKKSQHIIILFKFNKASWWVL